MSEQNKQTVIKFIEAFSDGDVETVKTCLATDALTVAKGFGKLSGPRPYELIVATTGAFKNTIPTGLRPKFLTVMAEGDRVAVEFEGNATLANGRDYCNQYCMVFTLQDGLIKLVNEYYCTILADDRILPLLADVEKQRQKTDAG
ncbi:nuclear transport factor 2 family protein [Acidocella sp.]|uniref:nuclear transport factor 2 family protein n=1 Tax=Acidocella sp. TaxID=50710 RepID=UPI0026116F59|nr:nuclear transport factor 2 family protein [Acidocella sp.]